MRARGGAVVGGAAVVAFAACIVVASVLAVLDEGAVGGARAADRFVAAWERMRTGTYVLEADFVRRSESGSELRGAIVIAQRPPERVIRQFGGVSGRLDDQPLLCGARPSGDPECRLGSAGRSFDESVSHEVEVLRTYFDPDAPLYTVVAAGDCFRLRRQRELPLAPYGETARFCFDERTGATRLIEVDHGDGITEVTTAREIRTDVRDADLAVDLALDTGGS
jgi:hypothetical protein